MNNKNWDAEIKEFRGNCHARTVMKDGSAWFIARDVFDYVGYQSNSKYGDLSQISLEEISDILHYYIDSDNINSLYSHYFKRDIDLINVSGIRELASLWFDDRWNNVATGVQKFLEWVRKDNILLQIIDQTVMAN